MLYYKKPKKNLSVLKFSIHNITSLKCPKVKIWKMYILLEDKIGTIVVGESSRINIGIPIIKLNSQCDVAER